MTIRFSPEMYACEPRETRAKVRPTKERREQIRAQLAEAGFKPRYEFRAEKQAKAMAAKIEKASGVPMETFAFCLMGF